MFDSGVGAERITLTADRMKRPIVQDSILENYTNKHGVIVKIIQIG